MNEDLVISKKGLNLIKKYEGFRAKAYQCPAGIWTIGYGTTIYPNGQRVEKGDECTEEEAETYLKILCNKFGKEVKSLITIPLKQNQFDALVSFRYNCGTGYFEKGVFKRYKIWKYVNTGEITKEYWSKLCVTVVGKKLNGLVKRRLEESDLYFSDILPYKKGY